MLKKSFALFAPMLAWGALAFVGNAFGQGCGTDFGGGCGGGSTNCGREISSADAAGLWAGYCTESCFDFSRNRQRGLRGGCADGGCFGYANGDCGTCGNGNIGGRGRLLGGRGGDCGCAGGRSGGRMFGGFGGGNFDGGSSCGYPGGGFGNCSSGCGGDAGFSGRIGGNRGGCGLFSGNRGGCGLFSGRGSCGGGREARPFRFLTGGNSPGLFARSAADCGSCGAYFNEAVGYEYGNAGLVSSVAGCGTDFAAPGCNGGASAGVSHDNSAQPVESGLMLAPQEESTNAVPANGEPANQQNH